MIKNILAEKTLPAPRCFNGRSFTIFNVHSGFLVKGTRSYACLRYNCPVLKNQLSKYLDFFGN